MIKVQKRKFEIMIVEEKNTLYIASGQNIEDAVSKMTKFVDEKYTQGNKKCKSQ